MTPTRGEVLYFRAAQVVSAFGDGVTKFGLPLLTYQLTGSPVSLAVAGALAFLPSLVFGLPIGAWTDGVDRQRVIVATDAFRALAAAAIPVAALAGALNQWVIYAVVFLSATVGVAHEACQFAAVPRLARDDADLVRLNGFIQATLAAAKILGPGAGGALLLLMSAPFLFAVDAATFAISAALLTQVRCLARRDDASADRPTIRHRIRAGLGFIVRHPVLRRIAVMMALVNFLIAPITTQLVVMAQQRFNASDVEIAAFYSASGLGVIVFSLLAARLRRWFTFSQVAVAAVVLLGVLLVGFSLTAWLTVGLVLWGLMTGLAVLFNINTAALRQRLVPDQMLGFVGTASMVIAWSTAPAGVLVGGVAVAETGDAPLVYGIIGVLVLIVAAGFARSLVTAAAQLAPAPAASDGRSRTDAVAR